MPHRCMPVWGLQLFLTSEKTCPLKSCPKESTIFLLFLSEKHYIFMLENLLTHHVWIPREKCRLGWSGIFNTYTLSDLILWNALNSYSRLSFLKWRKHSHCPSSLFSPFPCLPLFLLPHFPAHPHPFLSLFTVFSWIMYHQVAIRKCAWVYLSFRRAGPS